MPCLEPCPNCFARNDPSIKRVPGEGPRNASIMCVGEGPGKKENDIGRPFIGPSGEEYSKVYLPIAGLERREVYTTNTFRCKWADSGDTPSREIINSCASTHLAHEIEMVKPSVIVLMGGISNSLISQAVDLVHGTWRNESIFSFTGPIFSTLHPARALHKSSDMQSLLEDFAKLRLFLDGKLPPLVDAIPNPVFLDLTTPEEVDEVMDGRYPDDIAVDTESSLAYDIHLVRHYTPFCATFCIDPGSAFMVRVSNPAAWHRFGHHLKRFRRILMHNAPHDYRVLAMTGILLDWMAIEDTMEMAYVAGNLPKALKVLSYQVLGVTAPTFEDTTRPYGLRDLIEYFEKASYIDWPVPIQEPTGEMETKKCKECGGMGVVASRLEALCPECMGAGMVPGKKKLKQCPRCHTKGVVTEKAYRECGCDNGYVTVPKMTRKQGIGPKVSRLLTDFVKQGMEMNPWERIEGWGWQEMEPVIQALGVPPLPSVNRVPDDELIIYAGTDAHSTRRLRPELRSRLREIRKVRYEPED